MLRAEIPKRNYWKRQIKCQDACPVHTDARGYIRAIAAGDYESAYLIARGPNPLASICGRVCGAPCEANCRRGDIDAPLSIRALKRFSAEWYEQHMAAAQGRVLAAMGQRSGGLECADVDEFGLVADSADSEDTKPGTGLTVGIIGAGPAGLAAAHDLALLGFAPVIYERESVAAGMLYMGVPAYRLPRDVIRAEVAFIEELGVDIRTDVEVGSDVSLRDLLDRHDAVLVAVGARKSRILPLKGVEGGGVIGGIEFLRDVNLGQPVTLGREIVVIGGGNVAYDVARSTVRHLEGDVARSAVRLSGVHQVHLCCLESRDEMPADDVEVEEGTEEGVCLHNSLGPEEILRDEAGSVTGVRFKVVESVFDADGRFAPVFKSGVFEDIVADTVLFAIGQAFDLAFLEPDENSIDMAPNGLPVVDEALRTSHSGLYVAGDAARGPSLMIDAIASGKLAARSICEALTQHAFAAGSATGHETLPDYRRMAGYESRPRQATPTTDPAIRKASHLTTVECTYCENHAVSEAERCLDCGVNTIFDGNLCILCGGCADVCPEYCLRLVSIDELESDPELQSLLEHLAQTGSAPQSAIIKDETRCIRCGCCADRCPVGAVSMERFTFREALA